MDTFDLPPVVADLIKARNKLRTHYREVLRNRGDTAELQFTIDGNLVGDLAEAIAVELFGIRLAENRAAEGVDGYAPDGTTTVQIKATCTGRGPAFRQTKTSADQLLFFDFDFESVKGTIVYNGPVRYAVERLPNKFEGQRSLTQGQIRDAETQVKPDERLKRIKPLRD